MTSTAASESPLDGVRGLVFFSFPLHQPGKPETKRAEHLAAVTVPMLFLSGTRDELADLDLLRPVCEKLGGARRSTPGHGRPRLQDPQEVPRERGGRLRRDGPRRETGRPSARRRSARRSRRRSEAAPDLPLLAGGHSFSGRMTSTAASESPLEGVRGLVFFSFPLHLAGKPETKRADHLAGVTVPMLFLSGTRDELADLDLLRPVCEKLGERATLHVLDTADHGYKILKKSRTERRGRVRRDGPRPAGLGGQTGEQEARMKIATYNVNSIGARLPVLLHWLASSKPDVACLQELKTTDEKFPVDAIREAGYEAVWHGQKAWNGVAILARGEKPEETRRGLPGDPDDTHSRYIEAVVGGVTVGCLYLPNGNPAPGPKFDYKLKWFERLTRPRRGPARGGRARSSSRAITTSSRPSGTSTSPSGGSTTPCSCPRPARPTAGCSPRAGRMRCGTCTRTRRSTPSGTTCGAPSPGTRACASTTCS